MDINEEITKMNLYKTFEPYIDKSVTMEERLKARVRLVAVCVFDLLNSVGVSFFKLRQFPINKLPHQEFPFPVDVDTVCAVLR